MRAKFKNLIVEGSPDEVYMFYILCKFDKYFEKELKNDIKRQQKEAEINFEKLLNEIMNRFEED